MVDIVDIVGILDMLDWNKPPEIQSAGRNLARNIETISPYIQPLTPKINKNVWENCAIIITERNDESLTSHLVELLGWLQDLNWPGAFCILDRLQKYSDADSMRRAVDICIENARNCNDEVWECNLNMLLKKRRI